MIIKTVYSKFQTALNRLGTTEDGKVIFKYLQEEFVDKTALSAKDDINLTMFKLGQKELAQMIIKSSKLSDTELDAVSLTITTEGE